MGGFFIEASIENVGGAPSAGTVMAKSCGYLPSMNENSILVEWVNLVDVANPTSNVVLALNPGHKAANTNFQCLARNGRQPVAVRFAVAASAGETNLANNSVTMWTYKLDRNQ